MFLGAKSPLRRSALRFAIGLCGLFVVVLVLCGVLMVMLLEREVHRDIDDDLLAAHDALMEGAPGDGQISQWFAQNGPQGRAYEEAYRTARGQILGPVLPGVFALEGLHTLTAEDLFVPGYFYDLANLPAELDLESALFDDSAPPFAEPFGETGAYAGERWRIYVAPLGAGAVVLMEPLAGVEDALSLVPWVLSLVGAALVATTLIAGLALAYRQQRRLDQIHAGLHRIGRGDLGTPIAPGRVRDDLDQIMLGVDEAAQTLAQSMAQLRLFTQNVAHELNTPLARLRAQLEQTPQTPETLAALAQTDEVIRTLSGVQRITRLAQPPNQNSFAQVAQLDLAELMEALYGDLALENEQRLVIDLDRPDPIFGDYQLVAQMVSNLVENAIRHAGPGAQIHLRFSGTTVSVSDTGPGIAPHLRDQVFAPFERDHSAGGTGLGLALVRAIAAHHGADLSMDAEDGVTIAVRFPARAA